MAWLFLGLLSKLKKSFRVLLTLLMRLVIRLETMIKTKRANTSTPKIKVVIIIYLVFVASLKTKDLLTYFPIAQRQ